MFKTPERETNIIFSDTAIGWLPAPRLIVNSNRKTEFKKIATQRDNKISLETLLKDHHSLQLGLNSGSSYGLEIDNIIRDFSDSNHVYRHSGFGSTQALIRMLLANRVDYILEHSWVIKYLLTDEISRVTTIPIIESPAYIEVFIGCPQNAWGKSILQNLSPHIENIRNNSKSKIKKWIPNTEIIQYRKIYKKHS